MNISGPAMCASWITPSSAAFCFPPDPSFAPPISVCARGIDGLCALEEMSLDEVERHLIRRTLARHDGNVSQAAKALGLTRSALYPACRNTN